MAQKRKQYVKTATGLEKQLFESSADIVELDPIEGMTSTNVQDAIAELQNIAAQGGVTSVNGSISKQSMTETEMRLSLHMPQRKSWDRRNLLQTVQRRRRRVRLIWHPVQQTKRRVRPVSRTRQRQLRTEQAVR